MLQWQASEKACVPWSHRNKEMDEAKLGWLALGCACVWWCLHFSQLGEGEAGCSRRPHVLWESVWWGWERGDC